MKSKEEIEKLAKDYAETFRLKTQKIGWYFEKIEDYTKGYTQCQEDTEQEINRLKKIMIESSNQAMTWEEKYWQLKNSLNKQD